ncbi:MAG: thioredoxin domain-containing protein [Deltaproteobacteria bacterium]|nr:thioredoxin domain-containing protein [Deltaproteobacteria bacterium]
MRLLEPRMQIVAIAALLTASGCIKERHTVDLTSAARLGSENAPIEVVIFSDFQCVFCKRTAAELKRIHHSRPNRIKIYFKHFPLSYHPQAMNAAKAAEAAGLQGKFWEMHDQLFAYSAELTDEIYIEIAAKLGLDTVRFKKDMASDEIANRVAADRAEGESIGVDGTPYILINHTRFRGSYAYLSKRLNGQEGFK